MGYWEEVLNSDAELYGGSGQGNFGGKEATPQSVHGENHSLNVTLPPLAMMVFRLKL
jgi:1,4-alpha-glucan branching enzyme